MVREIMEKAKEAINSDKSIFNISSLNLSLNIVRGFKNQELINTKEIKVLLPNNYIVINSSLKPFESKTKSIWNNDQYKKVSEFVGPDGSRIVREDSDKTSLDNLEKFIKGNEISEKIKKIKTVSPKIKLMEEMWGEVFPLLLFNPLATNIEFKFVGKAKTIEHEVFVLDLETENKRFIRLFFDTETYHLMRMTEKYSFFDGEYENNYFFSDRKLIDKFLIPKKIKIENKFTATGKDTKTNYTYVEVTDLVVNPKFNQNLFDIK